MILKMNLKKKMMTNIQILDKRHCELCHKLQVISRLQTFIIYVSPLTCFRNKFSDLSVGTFKQGCDIEFNRCKFDHFALEYEFVSVRTHVKIH